MPRHYLNQSGCGNTVKAADPAVARMILNSLRYWAEAGGVDGYRFDLAGVLARDGEGAFSGDDTLLAAIVADPVLSGLKLIVEPWDATMEGHRLGAFPGFSEWNDRYRNALRRFWSGEGGLTGEMAMRLSGSSDVFDGTARRPSASVNFVTSHDGFSLQDLVSFTEKNNWANGEDNRDGESNNASFNCGIEGPTDDPAVTALRARQRRNLLATLLLSRGIPMLRAGDEFGHSQGGNNNAYCQDNETSWLDWSALGDGASQPHRIRLRPDRVPPRASGPGRGPFRRGAETGRRRLRGHVAHPRGTRDERRRLALSRRARPRRHARRRPRRHRPAARGVQRLRREDSVSPPDARARAMGMGDRYRAGVGLPCRRSSHGRGPGSDRGTIRGGLRRPPRRRRDAAGGVAAPRGRGARYRRRLSRRRRHLARGRARHPRRPARGARACPCRGPITGSGSRAHLLPTRTPAGGPAPVGTCGAALRAALGAQLGHGRFRRPQGPDRPRRAPRCRRDPDQPGPRPVPVLAGPRLALFAVEPPVPQPALYRCRGRSGLRRQHRRPADAGDPEVPAGARAAARQQARRPGGGRAPARCRCCGSCTRISGISS